ncbi:MAG: peptidoglycan-binding protein, partial [Thermoleophilaceae bacterium]|nr:peptidoglycan-binding protein [Thermoleophilaceae bacterium]
MSALERDLASDDLWQRSLERSRRRRVSAEKGRRETRRRKGGSVAMSAALLAAPTTQALAAVGTGQPSSSPSRLRSTAPPSGDILLRIGSRGEAVAAIQRLLGVEADGLFGPITRAAVREFQDRNGLPRTGRVNERTWSALLRFEAALSRRAAASEAAGTPGAVASRSTLRPTRTLVLAVDTSNPSRPRVAAKVADSRDERRARAAERAASGGALTG